MYEMSGRLRKAAFHRFYLSVRNGIFRINQENDSRCNQQQLEKHQYYEELENGNQKMPDEDQRQIQLNHR